MINTSDILLKNTTTPKKLLKLRFVYFSRKVHKFSIILIHTTLIRPFHDENIHTEYSIFNNKLITCLCIFYVTPILICSVP